MPSQVSDELHQATTFIDRVLRECPKRKPTSADEHKALELAKAELEAAGLAVEAADFRYNDNLYATIALHFGLGTVGAVLLYWAPLWTLGLCLLAGVSYLLDSSQRVYLLRRLFRFKRSQNLIATVPCLGEPRLRLVFLGHIDAALTGWVFSPTMVRSFNGTRLPRALGFLRHSVALATYAQLALAAFALARFWLGDVTTPFLPLAYLVAVPGLLTFVFPLQVALKNETVPGANDNLTAVAALPILARRLVGKTPPGVELVFVVNGCEEAGLGGGDALCRAMRDRWQRDRTVVLVLDSLSNGVLRRFDTEGEVVPRTSPAWLREVARQVSESEPRFHPVTSFTIPVGGTDAGPFLVRGYAAMALGCVDPELLAPRHYHLPSDNLENLDRVQLMHSIDYTEALARAICAHRLAPPAA